MFEQSLWQNLRYLRAVLAGRIYHFVQSDGNKTPPSRGTHVLSKQKQKTPLGLNERDNGSYQSFYQKRYDISVYVGFSYPKITLSITFKTRRKDNYRPAGVPKSTVHCLKTPCFFLAKKKNSTNKTGLSEFNLKLFFAYCSSQNSSLQVGL